MTQRRGKPQARVRLTFTGFHDPYSLGPVGEGEHEGPVLGLIRAHPVDRVVLFSTPNTVELTAATERAIHERHPDVAVETRYLALDDPTDYFKILTALRVQFEDISKRLGQVAYFVGTASGTPQMHASWVILVASGEVPARILHVRPPRFVTEHTPEVTEIDLSRPEFPTIRSRTWAEVRAEAGEDQDPTAVIERLGIVGDHPAISRALETAALLARSDVPVLVLGESGTCISWSSVETVLTAAGFVDLARKAGELIGPLIR